MPVDVEEANSPIKCQICWQEVPNLSIEIHKILTHDIINEHRPLCWIHVSAEERLEKDPINVLLLFSLE